MRFLIQAPYFVAFEKKAIFWRERSDDGKCDSCSRATYFVGVFTFRGRWFPDIVPDKEEEKKEVDQFRVGEVKDVVSGEDVLFQNTVTTIQIMFKIWMQIVIIFLSSYI